MPLYYPDVPTGTVAPFAGFSQPNGWLFCFGQSVSRTTYAQLFNTISPSLGTFTVTIASPGVVTLNSHLLSNGDAVYLTTTGALPTGLTANTLYYVIYVSANTFTLATSRANAYSSTAINTSGTQSGTHTLRACPYGLGDGSTTFTLPDLRGNVPAGNDFMGLTPANRLTLARSQGTYGNLGATGGAESHTITVAELATHKHSVNKAGAAGGDGSGLAWSSTSVQNDAHESVVGGTGSNTPHNNVQPTAVLNYMIKW